MPEASRRRRPFRDLVGKPDFSDLPQRQGHETRWLIRCQGAIEEWLRQNEAAIAAAYGERPLYTLDTKAPEPEIKILPDRNGKPVARYRLRADGSIGTNRAGNQPVTQDWERLDQHRHAELAADIWDETARRTPRHILSQLLFPSDSRYDAVYRPRALTVVTNLASRVLRQTRSHAIVDGARITPPQATATGAINSVLRKRFLKPKLLDLARRLFAPDYHNGAYDRWHSVSIAQYNIAAKHWDTLERMAAPFTAQNANAAYWYVRRYWRQALRRPAGNLSPSAVVKTVKADLDIHSPAEWQTFLRLPASGLSRHSMETPDEHRQRVKDAVTLITAANPDDDWTQSSQRCRRHKIVGQMRIARRAAELPWSHGDPKARWIQICGAYLRFQAEDGRAESAHLDSLSSLGDAFLAAVTEQRPWPSSGDYSLHREKSDRWHSAKQQAAYRKIALERRDTVWAPVVIAHDSDDRKRHCAPLTNPALLAGASDHLHNCLANYWRNCAGGNTIIFAFRDNETGHAEAAASLHRDNSTAPWRIGQVAGPFNRRAPEWAVKWSKHLVNIANDAAINETNP